MKRKHPLHLSLIGILAAALLLGLGGCSVEETLPAPTPTPAPSAETTAPLEFALPMSEGSLHPLLSTDKVNLTLGGLIWEGLFALDRTFTPQPVLCQSYSVSEDGLTWSFQLRSGVTFSDGTPLTAEEAATSLNLARSAQSRFAGRLSGIRSVAAEEGAVTVVLSAPNGALPALLDIPSVKGDGDAPLGTGPYVLEGGEAPRLATRSGWWQNKSLPVDAIPLRSIREADDLIYAFDTGDVSLVTADLTGTNALGFAGDYEVWDYPTSTMLFIGYNASSGPCADAALRRALDRGFDRTTAAVALLSRHAQAAALPVPPDSPLYDETLAQRRSYSPQALSELLTQAGYEKDGDGLWGKGRRTLALTFLVNTDNTFRLAVAEYLAEELTRSGITVDLQKLSWADYQKALSAGKFDLYLGATALSADFDPGLLTKVGGSLNFGAFQSGEIGALLAAYQRASGAERESAARSLWEGLEREAPFTVLCFKNQSVLTQWGAVSGLSPTQNNPFSGIENWTLGS